MKKTIRNKVVLALSLLFLSNITYSSVEKNELDENITTYLDYLRIDEKDILLLSREIIKFKIVLPKLGLVLLEDNANRDKKVFFCAIASTHYIERLKNKLGLIK
ncbi:TPA: hypothetical protein ACPFI9_003843 [Providencia rettgeri]